MIQVGREPDSYGEEQEDLVAVWEGIRELSPAQGLEQVKYQLLMCSHFFDGIDLIVPVPLHQRKKRLRGYNQSECLARGVSVVTGIPMNTKVVIRSRYTDTQTHKGQYARWENVRNLFACIFPDSLEGKHLLLVDDVLTTGATVVSCADAFRGIPGLRISVLTLALAGES